MRLAVLYKYYITFSCWIQNEVDKVVWCFGSSKVHLMHQSHRSLVLLLPLYNQLTLWYPLAFLKLINILPGDLKCVGNLILQFYYSDYLILLWYVLVVH